MRSIVLIVIAASILSAAIQSAPAQALDASAPAANSIIRVRLLHFCAQAARLCFSADSPFTIKDPLGNLVASGGSGSTISISCLPAGGIGSTPALQIADTTFGPQNSTDDSGAPPAAVTISTLDSQGAVSIGSALGGKRYFYRGSVLVSAQANGVLHVVNSVALEDYVRGVVKAEIGASAPIEALKAQAVAARTFAIHCIGRLWHDGADVDDTSRFQNYLGKSAECAATDLAVGQTLGQVVIYNGAVIDAMYCTECGGVTAEGPPTEPYLTPVKTAACAARPGWTYNISQQALASLVGLGGPQKAGKITQVEIDKSDGSGRVLELKLTGGNGEQVIGGNTLRQLLGPDNLRSTLFIVSQQPDGSWTFTGQGWGHGMGMCQQGAIARASGSIPEDYAQILADYYPGTQLTALTDAMVREPATPIAARQTAP